VLGANGGAHELAVAARSRATENAIHRGLSDDNMPEGTCDQKPWLMTATGENAPGAAKYAVCAHVCQVALVCARCGKPRLARLPQ